MNADSEAMHVSDVDSPPNCIPPPKPLPAELTVPALDPPQDPLPVSFKTVDEGQTYLQGQHSWPCSIAADGPPWFSTGEFHGADDG